MARKASKVSGEPRRGADERIELPQNRHGGTWCFASLPLVLRRLHQVLPACAGVGTLVVLAACAGAAHPSAASLDRSVLNLHQTALASLHDDWVPGSCGPIPDVTKGAQVTCTGTELSSLDHTSTGQPLPTMWTWLVTFQDSHGDFTAVATDCYTCDPLSGHVGGWTLSRKGNVDSGAPHIAR
jgi:hypothetical protein